MHFIWGVMLRSGNAVLYTTKAAGCNATFPKAASFATYASLEENWQALFNSPSEWEDLRPLKAAGGNPKMPDFCPKVTPGGVAYTTRLASLWINSWNTPAWVANKLPSLAVRAAQRGGKASSHAALWKSLFDHPNEWEDLRPIKAAKGNSRLPDFRKTSGVIGERAPVLWITPGRMPDWVAEKLPSLNVVPAVEVKKTRPHNNGRGGPCTVW